jgi:N-acetylglucosamine-6-phosphate deacetylase
VIEDGLVVMDGDRISWVGPVTEAPDGALPPAPPPGTTLLPGLVDVHCHGGGGASFPDALDEATVAVAVAEHLRHGTTTLVASLVTADEATLLRRTALLAELADAGGLAGIHLEGPYLSPARCGAQDPHQMTEGRPDIVRKIARAARGHLVTMTVAPEVPGVLGPDGVVTALAESGAIPSFGHTDTDADVLTDAVAQARTALSGPGARSARPTVTHLFNGMRPLHHRDPGPVAASLAAAARGEVVVELVADGVHLAPATIRMVFDLLGPGSIALVTDAMAAAGMPDGFYPLGSVSVHVSGGVARLKSGGAIAGGTAHMLDLVRTTVASGVSLVDAVTAATTTPATVLGRTDIGALAPGLRADVVEVDADLRPLRVMRAGTWVAGTAR